MTPAGCFTLSVVGIVFFVMARFPVGPDVAMVGGVTLLLVAQILSPADALAGMSNEAVATIGALFVVGAGVVETGGISWVAERLFGRPQTLHRALVRLTVPTAVLSSFMNNTPLVAMLIPVVRDWSKTIRIPPSRLMIPLSYAAIMGGTCTLIGTSTNLVVNGMTIAYAAADKTGQSKLPAEGFGLFEISWLGVPVTIVGCTFLVLATKWLLPERLPAISQLQDPRQYTLEMQILADCPLVGKTIEEAGLRHLPGVYLAEIDRNGTVLAAVGPQVRLQANDRLVFVGVVESVVELRKIRGLVPAAVPMFGLGDSAGNRTLCEAVVSDTCPLVGKTVREGRFRSVYDAAVIAVARNGERVRKKIGDITLRTGDTLLLETHPNFVEQHRNSRDFFLVSRMEGYTPRRHERGPLALGILLVMVLVATVSELIGSWRIDLGGTVVEARITMLHAAMVAAGLMLMTRCLTLSAARDSINWQVLVAIAASFALGKALTNTGVDRVLGESLMNLAGGEPRLALAAIYILTLLITELVTNNAAAALMFPMALATAAKFDASPLPFLFCVMISASCGFATPIGYQTNLMVYGPGGYRFGDYLRLGVPLDVILAIVSIVIAPLVWPFWP